MSCVGTVLLNQVFHSYLQRFQPRLREISYVDNLQFIAADPDTLFSGYLCMEAWATMVGLQLDAAITVYWATSERPRSVVLSLLLTTLPWLRRRPTWVLLFNMAMPLCRPASTKASHSGRSLLCFARLRQILYAVRVAFQTFLRLAQSLKTPTVPIAHRFYTRHRKRVMSCRPSHLYGNEWVGHGKNFKDLAGTELVLSAKHAMYVWRCDYHWCCCRVLRCQMCMAVCALQLGCWVLAASVISAEDSMAKLWFSQPRKVEARMFQTSNRCKKLRGERWKGDLYTGYFFGGGGVQADSGQTWPNTCKFY